MRTWLCSPPVQHLGRDHGDEGVTGDCIVDPDLGRRSAASSRASRRSTRCRHPVRGRRRSGHKTLLARLGHDDLPSAITCIVTIAPTLLALGGARRRGIDCLSSRSWSGAGASRTRTAGFFFRVVVESLCSRVCRMFFLLANRALFLSGLPVRPDEVRGVREGGLSCLDTEAPSQSQRWTARSRPSQYAQRRGE